VLLWWGGGGGGVVGVVGGCGLGSVLWLWVGLGVFWGFLGLWVLLVLGFIWVGGFVCFVGFCCVYSTTLTPRAERGHHQFFAPGAEQQ